MELDALSVIEVIPQTHDTPISYLFTFDGCDKDDIAAARQAEREAMRMERTDAHS